MTDAPLLYIALAACAGVLAGSGAVTFAGLLVLTFGRRPADKKPVGKGARDRRKPRR